MFHKFLFFFQAKDIFKIHKEKCKHGELSMQVSCDGMSESKSTSVSLDVYSSRMKNCQVIYPYRIVRPLGKNVVDNKEQFSKFLEDIQDNGGKIEQYIADNLKRATGKCCLNHSASFPCEYCFSKGVRLVAKDDKNSPKKQLALIKQKLNTVAQQQGSSQLKTIEKEVEKAQKQLGSSRSHIVWPSSTSNGDIRTHDNMMQIINKVEVRGKLPAEEAKGVVGKSPLCNIPNFNFVMDSPTEYLHSVCIGVTKRNVELTFNVGENRTRITKRKLSDPALFNKLMQCVKVVREFSRRIRDLDFAVYKGQEFRNLVLFFFPIIIQCIETKAKERKLWLLFSFMIRACIIPQKEYSKIDDNDIIESSYEFYVLYESLFGKKNCTYNTHIVGSHLLEMRYHGPLTFTSAFGFEAFYGELRHSFTPGTQSTLKQCFQKILLKRSLAYHCCEKTIFYSNSETQMEDNTLIYVYQDDTHKMYKIIEVREESLLCYRQGKYKYEFPETKAKKLNWAQVGVYKKGLIGTETEVIMKKNVHGKVLKVDNLLITCPNAVLREK